MDVIGQHLTSGSPAGVKIAPPSIVRRRFAAWGGIQGDTLQITRLQRFEYGILSPFHLLIAAERAERDDGETLIEGCQKSTRREFNRRLTFIPAGRRFYGWQKPRVLMRTTYLYLDPAGPLFEPEMRVHETEFEPRLFFFDHDLWETASKLKAQVENPVSSGYAEALGLVLAHELLRLQKGITPARLRRGGLASWQQKKVSDYIEEKLGEDISLLDLAALVRLSPFHFARSFKQSFGVPPHRYQTARRMERAKALLEASECTVTEIALMLGYSETSAFTSAFRRSAGTTPSDYRRAIA